jgi:hypothetical protein
MCQEIRPHAEHIISLLITTFGLETPSLGYHFRHSRYKNISVIKKLDIQCSHVNNSLCSRREGGGNVIMFYPVFQIWRIIVSIKAIELLDITLLEIEILHVYSTVMYIKYSIIHEENTKEITTVSVVLNVIKNHVHHIR